MTKSKKINVLSFAKFQAVLTALIGLIAGAMYSVGGFIVDLLVSTNLILSSETQGIGLGTILAFGALIGMPVVFGALGFALGILEALAFNLLAKYFGGVNIDFYSK